MIRITEKIPAFNGAAPGTQPTSQLVTRGRSYEYISLRAIGSGPAAAVLDFRNVISSVELLHNNKVESIFYPKEQRCFTDYRNANGDALPADFMRIPLWRPGIPNSELGTADLDSLTVRCNVVAALPASTTFTRIDGTCAYFQENANRDEYFVNTAITPPNATPVVGTNVIERMETGGLNKLAALYITAPPALASLTDSTGLGISEAKVEVDGVTVFDQTRDDVNNFLAHSPIHYNLGANQFGFYIPLNANNDARDFLNLLNPDGSRKFLKLTYVFAGTPAPMRILMAGTKGAPTAAK